MEADERNRPLNAFNSVITDISFPCARSGHRIACNSTDLYLFGGYNPDGRFAVGGLGGCFKELWKYNYFSQDWTLLRCNNIPNEVASSALLMIGDCLVIYGGTSIPFGETNGDKLYMCNITKSGSELAFVEVQTNGDRPPALYGTCIAQCKGYIYLVGGTDGFAYFMDIYRLHVATRVWECIYKHDGGADGVFRPKPRYRHEIVIYNDEIYIFGGGLSDQLDVICSLETIPVFNINNLTWRMLSALPDIKGNTFPADRKCAGLVQHPVNLFEVYIIAGTGKDGIAYRDTWSINLKTLRWKRLPLMTLPRPTYFHATTISPTGRIFCHGGINFLTAEEAAMDIELDSSDDDEEFADNEVSERTNRMFAAWTNVPTLVELCLEVVSYSHVVRLPGFQFNRIRSSLPATVSHGFERHAFATTGFIVE